MAAKIWSGTISFGLVNIPVSLVSAKETERVSFRMLDKRDHAPVGYKTINKNTGQEIDRSQIVKGFEYEPQHYVEMSDKEIQELMPEKTRRLDLEDFVDVTALDPLLCEKPYYLLYEKGGEKGYFLLLEAMKHKHKAALGRIVLHNRQRFAALLARGEYLVLEVLRFSQEVTEPHEARFLKKLSHKRPKTLPSLREIKMAESLVEEMSSPWRPHKYHETFQQDLLKRIREKIRTGKVATSPLEPEVKEGAKGEVADLMSLLKESLRKAEKITKSAG